MHMNAGLLFMLLVFALLTACTRSPAASDQRARPAGSPAATSTPDQFAATRQIYAKDCAVCHGDTGEGKTATVEGKRIKAPSLRSGHALNHPDEDFVKQIKKGGDGMPAFETKRSQAEIDELVRFIRQEFQGGRMPRPMPSMRM